LKNVCEIYIFNPITHSLWGKAIRSLKVLISECREDCIIHSHNLYASAIISLCNSGFRHVLTLHYPPTIARSKEGRRLLENALRYFDKIGIIITAPSPYIRDELRKIGLNRVIFLLNGVDTTLFSPLKRSEELREMLLEGRDILIVNVGRIHPDKNQLALLKALKKLIYEYNCKSIKLLLIGPITGSFRGGSRENPYYKLLIEYTNKHDLKQYVKFMELPRRDVAKVLASSDIYVHPSKVEASPLAVLEAMASKLPIVAFDLPYYKGYLINGVNTILLPLNNVNLLAETLYTLLNDRSLAVRISKNAYEIATNYFSWNVLAGKYLDFYNTLIQI
ncbi:MAG: glycosyltransferase family 4 protein, partial [Desulfurococcaceae archaeon]|nr:glycosyltransferase family 4 protein [Desulfurococcaceae archaeon]